MKYPCRCNRRDCQARRTLNKHPDAYKRPPRCHGCRHGTMYLDKYRKARGAKDNPPVCYDDCYHYPHRTNSKHCKHREDWKLERSLAPKSRHDPYQHHESPEEAPF